MIILQIFLPLQVLLEIQGHIGIPIAIILFDHHLVDVFIFAVLGTMLYQNSVGYFITAKGSFYS